MHPSALLPLVLLPFSFAAQQKVKVGNAKGELVFDPPRVKAGKGDTIDFIFYPQDHSVAQSTFDKPCQPLDKGIFSGFFPVKEGTSNQIFTVTVNSTDPIWLYCSQEGHCAGGMAMVINEPSGKTLQTYLANAKTSVTDSSSQPKVVAGGVISDQSSDNSSTSAGTSSTMATATSGTATGSNTAAGTATGTATGKPNAAGKVSAGAGLGALGLLGVLVGGVV